MKKFLSTENFIRSVVVIALIAFASTKYDLKNIIFGLLIMFAMALLGGSIVRLYQEFKSYLKTKEWELSQIKTIIFVLLIILIPVIFLILLTPNLKLYSFLIVGVVLIVLFIYDLIRKIV